MCKYAKTYFDKNGRLIAEDFDDVYFSIEGGLEETKYVFLAGNNLPQNWKGKENFTIIETGFGTGLNFLTTWKMLDESKLNTQLHFISVEKFPLKEDVFQNSLNEYTELKTYKSILNKKYHQLIQNEVNTVEITKNITLTLLVGDVKDVLQKAPQKADAWFLDGFSPSKNPEMWQDSLYKTMANLSKPQANFATFTAAGIVRKGLENAGFNVERMKGFGHKRHMTKGKLSQLNRI